METLSNGWKPIETAPTDGTRILAWCEEWMDPMTVSPSHRGWTPGFDLGPTKHQPTHWFQPPEPPRSPALAEALRIIRKEKD